MNAAVATPIDATNPSQKIAVHCVATSLGELFVIERSWYIRYALTLPPTVPVSAKIAGILSQITRARPRTRTASINKGMSHKNPSLSRARSKPLTESFIPTQLNCTQGRKKQIKTNVAKLKVVRRALLMSLPVHHETPFVAVRRRKRYVCRDRFVYIKSCPDIGFLLILLVYSMQTRMACSRSQNSLRLKLPSAADYFCASSTRV